MVARFENRRGFLLVLCLSLHLCGGESTSKSLSIRTSEVMWHMMLEEIYLILEMYHHGVVMVINHPLVENMDLECEGCSR